jgi:hypothetical protein
MRSEFDVPADMLIQFDAKGSYRHGTVEAFLKWVLPLETNPADSFVVNLDWFAAHLCPEVQRLIENLGHVRLMIPGGITPDVQVPDTHLNQPLNREYQNLEIRDSNLELATRADSVPSTSRQTVATRIYEAWQRSQASNEESAWIQNGILNDLDGVRDTFCGAICNSCGSQNKCQHGECSASSRSRQRLKPSGWFRGTNTKMYWSLTRRTNPYQRG